MTMPYALALLATASWLALPSFVTAHPVEQPSVKATAAPLIALQGKTFKDLDHNGKLDPYEDWRLSAQIRAHDLVSRMKIEEKAGLLMFGTPVTVDGGLRGAWDVKAMASLVQERHVLAFINRSSAAPKDLAETSNAIQSLAENTRLGIPVTISSDPRNQFQATMGLSVASGQFSLWPDAPGLAASGDPAVARSYAATARQEYKAVGITMAFAPQVDLSTEPRWARVNGTFGENPALARKMSKAVVEGFQDGGDGLKPSSVVAIAKHWVGYGAQPGGFDAHSAYGKTLAFPGGQFETHIIPWRGAFEANVGGVMPDYPIPPKDLMINGKPAEQVGGAFSKSLIHDLLRQSYHFNGLVLTDWAVTDDCSDACEKGSLKFEDIGMPWGVESLTKSERFAKALDAGVDQFGGVMNPEILVDLVHKGRVTQARIDESAQRILIQKFQVGLFENPYVAPDAANAIVGSPVFRDAGLNAQRRSLVLLKNDKSYLPLKQGSGKKAWLYNVSPDSARLNGFEVVTDVKQADIAILRIAAPFEQNHKNYFFGNRQHEGSLSFKPDNPDLIAVQAVASANVPSVVSVYLEWPAILTPIVPLTKVLIGNFGVSDQALFDVLMGRANPTGKLPFELPSSEEAVERQLPDVPHDSQNPLFPISFGLTYEPTK